MLMALVTADLETGHSQQMHRTGQERDMKEYEYVTLRQKPELAEEAAGWFSKHWGIAEEAYRQCMNDCLQDRSNYDWFLCLNNGQIIAGLGVIANDFHQRKDLTPNICAVYTEEAHRNQGIAGKLLNMAVEDMRNRGISPLYLLTDHSGFYERYGWQFLCYVSNEDGESESRMYVHY